MRNGKEGRGREKEMEKNEDDEVEGGMQRRVEGEERGNERKAAIGRMKRRDR